MGHASEKEIRLIDKASSEFAGKKLAKVVESSAGDTYSKEYSAAVMKAYELDFFHMMLPETAGGSEAGLRAFCRLLENIGTEDSSLAAILLSTALGSEMLIRTGNEDLASEILNDKKSPQEFLLATPFFKNPESEGIALIADGKDGDFWLNGGQENLVLGGLAEKAIVPARLNGSDSFAFYLADLSGTSLSPVSGLGLSYCPVTDTTFKNTPAMAFCPPEKARDIFRETSSLFSVAVAAIQTGLMKGAFKDALEYTSNRQQGGRKIIHWSEIKKILSGMAINIQVAEMLVNQCCTDHENQNRSFAQNAEAAFCRISEMACEGTSDGIRVMGGVGYMKDFNQEKRFRDARHLMSAFGMMQVKKVRFLEKHITKSATYTIQEGPANELLQ